MREVKGKVSDSRSLTVLGNVATVVHTTLHKATEKHFELRTVFDFADVPQDRIIALATETLVIRWRTAFKNAETVDDSCEKETVKVKEMLKGKKPRMSRSAKAVSLMETMSKEDLQKLLQEQAKKLGIEIVLPTEKDKKDEEESTSDKDESEDANE